MRYPGIILTLILLLSVSDLSGQAEDSFIINRGALSWQKKYENHSSSDIIELFRESGLIEKTVSNNNRISGILKSFEPDLSSTGYSLKVIPGYLKGVIFTGHMTVAVNGHSYTVSINEIKLINKSDKSASALETYALKGSMFNPEFSKNPSEIISLCFEKRLSLVTTEDKF